MIDLQTLQIGLTSVSLGVIVFTALRSVVRDSHEIEQQLQGRLKGEVISSSDLGMKGHNIKVTESKNVIHRFLKYVRQRPVGYVFVELEIGGKIINPQKPFDEETLEQHRGYYNTNIEKNVEPLDEKRAHVQMRIAETDPDTVYDFIRGFHGWQRA